MFRYGDFSRGEGAPVRDAPSGKCELPGCDPDRNAQVFVLDAKSAHGVFVELSGKNPDRPQLIQLKPCGSATARLVDERRKPVSSRVFVDLVLAPGVRGRGGPQSPELIAAIMPMDLLDRAGHSDLRTDAQGRIVLPNLIPGRTYWLYGPETVGAQILGAHLKEFTVGPGQKLDLGDIVIKSRP